MKRRKMVTKLKRRQSWYDTNFKDLPGYRRPGSLKK